MTQAVQTPEAPVLDEYAQSLGHDQTFTTREVPWMKLGKIVDEAVTAAEAAKLGGIDFTVSAQPISYMKKVDGQPPRYTKIEKRKAIVHDGTGECLSVVSAGYPIIQYAEAFDFMDGISPRFVAAGSLRGGRQAFMVVKPDITLNPFDEDPHELYATLRTSHDCSRAVEVQVMPLRGRCMNQLTLNSFRVNVKHRWVVHHAGNVAAKLAAAADSMSRIGVYAQAYVENAHRLEEIKVTDDVAEGILKRVLKDRPKRPEVITKILTGWHTRPDTVGFDGTGWGLVNAVSEYMEWDRALGTTESRFIAALQGPTHSAINKTASYLLSRSA